MNRLLSLLTLCVLFLSPGLAAARPLQVMVSILPQQYFAERIGGDLAQVTVMVEPGGDPHVYEPKPQQMVALSRADLYLAVGVTFEDVWLSRFQDANPDMLVVHTDAGVDKLPMAEHHHEGGHEEDAHQGAEEAGAEHHEHGILDPHIWLAPSTARVMAENILHGLEAADPDNAAAYQANFEVLSQEIAALDQEIRAVFAPIPEQDRRFLVFHPAWGYFAHEYGLTQLPVEVSGREPSPGELAAIIHLAEEHAIPVIFVQPQMSERTAQTIAGEINARVAVLDPLAPNWADNLRAAAQAFATAME